MKNWILFFTGIAAAAIFSMAFAAQLDKAAMEDIARHRVMATAHENAAKCLEAGKPHDICGKQLQVECKGIAIGKFCGMKHQH